MHLDWLTLMPKGKKRGKLKQMLRETLKERLTD